jgi:starch synthase (maltosyl-transferring)
MTPGATPDLFHGQFVPGPGGAVDIPEDGWGDPITTWRHAVTAKLDAGQGETELNNDLLVGAQLAGARGHRRAA